MDRVSPARILSLLAALAVAACGGGSPPGPASITLASVMPDARVENTPDVPPAEPIEWDFTAGPEGDNVDALHQVSGLSVSDGALRGRATGEDSALLISVPMATELKGTFHSLEVRLRVEAGETTGLSFSGAPEFDRDEWLEEVEEDGFYGTFETDVESGEDVQTITLSTAGSMIGSLPMSAMRNLVLQPSDAAGDFAIESIRLKSLEEHLQSIPSGVSWQGLSEVYRETLVTRTPESVSFDLVVPPSPWLDLSIGTIEPGPARFIVEVTAGGSTRELVRRTVTTENEWTRLPLGLDEFAGQTVTLTLKGEAEAEGRLLYWGGPVIRSRGDSTVAGAESEARAQLAAGAAPPKRILFILADTLRRDRLPWYGGERDNAPHLAKIAEQGTVFTKNVSQGTWTKVSVPAILTSLYATSHGLSEIPDRLPSSVTTLGEALRDAGYSTYATSSVPFTGKLTNLHQGIETLQERGSIGELPHSGAKTARTYVDRLLPWIEAHAETPWFVFLHVFDPHSPLEPYPPYDTLYTDEGEIEAHRERITAVQEVIEDDHMRGDVMPTAEELEEAEVDAEAFVNTEHDWYDASIKGMDAEIGRVLERLEQLGILEDTLIVFISDHGEEFLEHGRHFHGHNAYGEMLNVPLMMWWPGVIPAGRSDEIVQSIDVMPTVLDLARIAAPDQVQGQSLLPLMIQGEAPSRFGWVSRPAFSEREGMEEEFEAEPDKQANSLVMIADGWKLVKNTRRPEGWPEFELYDYDNDPMDQVDLAAENPDIVASMAEELDAWHERALAARIEEADAADLTPEEEARLRALGYIQ